MITQVEQRRLRRELAGLRREFRAVMRGDHCHWGMPWCQHREPEPPCEGCATRLWCRDQAEPLVAHAREIAARSAADA